MKSGKRVFHDLYEHHWANDTLSPLSLGRYEKLANKMVAEDETVYSALLGQGSSLSLTNQVILVLATNKNLIVRRQTGDIRSKDLIIPYARFKSLTLLRDSHNYHRYYAKLRYRTHRFGKIRVLKFEILDPTSAFHFEEFVEQKSAKNNH
ncbi:hypothetical protein JN01_0005 [Entomoplasma freundtii]|uniref:Uncharacterized protein n=1 Tax=Entomoplasma freundtii TaxID=74700 RepID=A0A2K8NQF3_9MOLU|nr:hypothetical protein [Entomoplasma freundtii]ATZ16070.1 hypothetical protein EFREU_v1c00430 [Entomoplasma freundtii]TDY58061.1 hypothetical protein JN01_0005 [Entomoplasma freundtii]